MTLTVYSIACLTFILACLAMLWPINAASRGVAVEIRQLKRELNSATEAETAPGSPAAQRTLLTLN
jgi:hypothetical protein